MGILTGEVTPKSPDPQRVATLIQRLGKAVEAIAPYLTFYGDQEKNESLGGPPKGYLKLVIEELQKVLDLDAYSILADSMHAAAYVPREIPCTVLNPDAEMGILERIVFVGDDDWEEMVDTFADPEFSDKYLYIVRRDGEEVGTPQHPGRWREPPPEILAFLDFARQMGSAVKLDRLD